MSTDPLPGPPLPPPRRGGRQGARGRRGPSGAGTAGRTGRAAGRAAARAGRAAARGGRATWRGSRALVASRGAGESGLARVTDLHLVSSAADALVVTALASTIFFAVPTTEARGRVATSLLVTMVPFVLLAPVLGPLLDRVRRGRRYALATTMVVRAFLAWVMAGALSAGGSEADFTLYPAAFGFLVCQKAYIITRAAAVPRVLPRGTELVAANSRISMAGVAALVVAAPLGAGLSAWVGPGWTLRLAFGVFAAGTAVALALPPRVDSDEGEVPARISSAVEPDDDPRRWSIGPRVVLGLRANVAVRAFAGFVTLYLAFRLRTDPLPGVSGTASVLLVIGLLGVGGGLGTGLGTALRRVRPETLVLLVVVAATLAAAWATLAYGLVPVLAVALAAGTGQTLAKLGLDALVQQEVPEAVRTSAFARSETVLQLAWVLGGFTGLALPVPGPWGMGVATVVAGVAAVTGIVGAARTRSAPRARRDPDEGPLLREADPRR